jgi:hypothetical protein
MVLSDSGRQLWRFFLAGGLAIVDMVRLVIVRWAGVPQWSRQRASSAYAHLHRSDVVIPNCDRSVC